MKKLWCIVYRTGGTDNFKWRRSLNFAGRGAAILRASEMREAGYHAMVFDYYLSMSAGLPDTFSV
uniref:Uncharacterized protein n=1 Tax=viral metagenome TaxID=1070528 RepID=A0A6H2A202_9ZZZZ